MPQTQWPGVRTGAYHYLLNGANQHFTSVASSLMAGGVRHTYSFKMGIQDWTITKAGFRATKKASADALRIRVAIYSDSGQYPNSLLADFGDIGWSGTVFLEESAALGSSLTLSKDTWYWLSIQVSTASAAASFSVDAMGNAGFPLGRYGVASGETATNPQVAGFNGLRQTGKTGAFPATFDASVDNGSTIEAVPWPVFYVDSVGSLDTSINVRSYNEFDAFLTNRYYPMLPPGIAAINPNTTMGQRAAGFMVLYPLYMGASGTFKAADFYHTTTSSRTQTLGIAVYNADSATMWPTTLFKDIGTVSLASTTRGFINPITISPAMTLAADTVYWMAVLVTDNTAANSFEVCSMPYDSYTRNNSYATAPRLPDFWTWGRHAAGEQNANGSGPCLFYGHGRMGSNLTSFPSDLSKRWTTLHHPSLADSSASGTHTVPIVYLKGN